MPAKCWEGAFLVCPETLGGDVDTAKCAVCLSASLRFSGPCATLIGARHTNVRKHVAEVVDRRVQHRGTAGRHEDWSDDTTDTPWRMTNENGIKIQITISKRKRKRKRKRNGMRNRMHNRKHVTNRNGNREPTTRPLSGVLS